MPVSSYGLSVKRFTDQKAGHGNYVVRHQHFISHIVAHVSSFLCSLGVLASEVNDARDWPQVTFSRQS